MTRAHDIALAALARTQGGVLTEADLVAVTGRPDELQRRLRGGAWRQLVPGIVAPAAMPDDPSLRAIALCLGPERSLLSHYDAARLSGIWVPADERTWVTVPFTSPVRELPGIRVVRSRVFPGEFLRRGPLRWTLPARTVVDLGMVLTRRQLEAVLLSGVRQGLVTAAGVAAEARGLRGRKGVERVRRVAALWTPERESLLEDVLFKEVCAVAGSGVVRQHEVRTPGGTLVARLDVALPELRLGFEADGLAFHSTDEQLAADQRRDRRLLALGWSISRFREGVLDDRAAVRREVAAVLAGVCGLTRRLAR